MNAAGFLKARSNPLLCIYSYCGLQTLCPLRPHSLKSLHSFHLALRWEREWHRSAFLRECTALEASDNRENNVGEEPRKSSSMQSCPGRKHRVIPYIQSWQTTLVRSSPAYTSLCLPHHLIFTSLQSTEKKAPPSLSASTPASIPGEGLYHLSDHLLGSTTPAMLRTFTSNHFSIMTSCIFITLVPANPTLLT